jgi:hypothetical protein
LVACKQSQRKNLNLLPKREIVKKPTSHPKTHYHKW